jgi:cation:H+ antiporter
LILIVASSYVVQLSESLASIIGVTESLIGILILAVGTNLPELTIMLTSKGDEEEKLALGNLFGSACVNAGILGLLSVLAGGFEIKDFESIVTGIVILALALILFTYFSWTGRKIDRFEGFLLIGLYVAMIITEIIVKIT